MTSIAFYKNATEVEGILIGVDPHAAMPRNGPTVSLLRLQLPIIRAEQGRRQTFAIDQIGTLGI